jgi:hypothetical protein
MNYDTQARATPPSNRTLGEIAAETEKLLEELNGILCQTVSKLLPPRPESAPVRDSPSAVGTINALEHVRELAGEALKKATTIHGVV